MHSTCSKWRYEICICSFVLGLLLSLLEIKAGVDPGFFFRRGCTRLLLYFNTNKPHSFFFFLQNTSCIRKPQVISEGGGGVHPLHPPPRYAPDKGFCIISPNLKFFEIKNFSYFFLHRIFETENFWSLLSTKNSLTWEVKWEILNFRKS